MTTKTISLLFGSLPNAWSTIGTRCSAFLLCLSLCLLSAPVTYAASMAHTDWRKNINIDVKARFGIPYLWLLEEEDFEESAHDVKDVVANSNWQFGPVVGYCFPIRNNTLAIGPEVGLLMGTAREVRICGHHGNFFCRESYIRIPLALKLTTYSQKTGVQENGMAFGCELRVLRSSQLSQVSGYSDATIRSELKKVEDIAKSTKLAGNIFLEGRVDIFKGFYLVGMLKFPVTDFLAFGKAGRDGHKGKEAIYAVRLCSESLAEVGVGVNIMKWL